MGVASLIGDFRVERLPILVKEWAHLVGNQGNKEIRPLGFL
jgi:hypothetical protein